MEQRKKRILIVEDEKNIADILDYNVQKQGYDTAVAYDGEKGLALALSGGYDLILLDVMLPKMDGFEICRRVRERLDTPIIMLTAKSELDDTVTGLDCGADDYLTKPFRTRELLAWLRALGRRSRRSADGALAFGDIELNRGASLLVCGENSVRLSEKEFRILEYLIANAGQILTREQLAVKIWDYESDAEYNNVEVYMSFARKKLNFVKARTEIKAVRGVGYELRYRDV